MTTRLFVCVLLLGGFTRAWAIDPEVQAELDALKAKVEQQADEIRELRSSNADGWLTARRAEEIKSLVHEVLADAQTRSSFQEGSLTAGWYDHFFLTSNDGDFLLRLRGQVQARYIANETRDATREHTEGFELRRTMLSFDGHLYNPRFTYQVSLLMSDDDVLTAAPGFARLQNAWAAYEFAEGWQIKGGQFKAPFLRDELVHSARQLAVERALVTDLWTVDYTQGAEIAYNGQMSGTPLRVKAMIHDGSYASNASAVFVEDVDIAIATRAEVLLAGTWEQFEDYAAWSGDSFGLMLGAAVDYENAEGEDGSTGSGLGLGAGGDVLKWTADISAEIPEASGFNVMAAVIGVHPRERSDPDYREPDQFSTLVQAGVFVIPDKLDIFTRWEYIYLDGQLPGGSPGFATSGLDDDIHILTFGSNYYFRKHSAKATFDIVWILDETAALTSPAFFGNGILPTTEDNQLVLRGQFQFLF